MVSLKHQKVSSAPDSGDPSIVQGSDWNAEHTLTCSSGVVLGRSTAGTGVAEEISIGSGLTLSGGVLTNTGGGGGGGVSTVSVVSANGLAGTVANATTTPAITLSTTVTGLIKGDGTSLSAAASGTDYQAPIGTITGLAKGNGANALTSATAGTDYAPATSGSAILKGNGAGGFSSAASGTDYAPATSGASILYGNGAGGFSNVTIGSGLSFAAGTLTNTGGGGGGGVSSVGGTGTVNGITLSGTVTSSGNLTLGGALDLSAPPDIGGTTPAAITGTNIASATSPTNTVPTLALTGTPNNALGAKTGVLGIGPNFTAADKNIIASFVQSINDYTQIVVQNPNSGTSASADFIVNNDNTTGTGTFGDFGINSSTFSGTGSFSAANATYLYSNGGDLVIGTQSANILRFPIGSATASDAATITSTGLNATVIGATTPAAITGTDIIATSGMYAKTTFGGSYTDGIVVDYLTGNGRISVGTADTITFYTGGVANTPVGQIPTMAMAGIIPMENWVRLTSTYTLTSQTAAQKLFNASTNGAVTLPIGTYNFECGFALTSMSATSGSFGFALGVGTAVIGTQGWFAWADKAAAATASTGQITWNTAANTTLVTGNTTTTGQSYIKGTFTVTTAGTVIPQVSLGVASAAVVAVGSFFRCSPVASSATATTVGNWS